MEYMTKYRKEDFKDLTYLIISVVIFVGFIVYAIKTLFFHLNFVL